MSHIRECVSCDATTDLVIATVHVSFEWRGWPQDGERYDIMCRTCAEEEGLSFDPLAEDTEDTDG